MIPFQGQQVIRVGWLEQTFGERCPCADKILQDQRPKEIRVHIANGPCLRNRRCGRYEIFYGQTIASANRRVVKGNKLLLGKFHKVLDRLAARLAASRGPLTCYVSAVLESDLNEKARSILYRLTANRLPDCVVVDNPLRGKCIRGAVCERHGQYPGLDRPCIADLDGEAGEKISRPHFLERTRGCDLSFLWSPRMNCNGFDTSVFIDPRKRNCAYPRAYYEGLIGWLAER
jgi:hypothetical protein